MKPLLIVVAALALGLGTAVVLRAPSAASSTPPAVEPRAAEFHRLVEAGALLLDVRTPEEFSAGHLPGAVNIPVGELMGRVSEVGDRARPVVVYCASGARSAQAARLLASAGFGEVHNLGGMSAW